MPTSLGRPGWLDEGMFFEGVDTPEGWIDAGDVGVVFQRDGSTDAARLVIADEDGRRAALEVRPLQDRVRILEGDDAT